MIETRYCVGQVNSICMLTLILTTWDSYFCAHKILISYLRTLLLFNIGQVLTTGPLLLPQQGVEATLDLADNMLIFFQLVY